MNKNKLILLLCLIIALLCAVVGMKASSIAGPSKEEMRLYQEGLAVNISEALYGLRKHDKVRQSNQDEMFRKWLCKIVGDNYKSLKREPLPEIDGHESIITSLRKQIKRSHMAGHFRLPMDYREDVDFEFLGPAKMASEGISIKGYVNPGYRKELESLAKEHFYSEVPSGKIRELRWAQIDMSCASDEKGKLFDVAITYESGNIDCMEFIAQYTIQNNGAIVLVEESSSPLRGYVHPRYRKQLASIVKEHFYSRLPDAKIRELRWAQHDDPSGPPGRRNTLFDVTITYEEDGVDGKEFIVQYTALHDGSIVTNEGHW